MRRLLGGWMFHGGYRARRADGRWLSTLVGVLGSRGAGVLVALDAALVTLSFALVMVFRHDGVVPHDAWHSFLWFAPVAVLVFVVVQSMGGLYSRIWRFASVLEARHLLTAGVASGALLLAADLAAGRFVDRPVPLTVVVAGSTVSTGLIGCTRFQSRLLAVRRRSETSAGLRVVVVGAGDTGAALVRQMWHSPKAGLVPVALIDDDPGKQGRTVLGIRVVGSTDGLARAIRSSNAHQVVLAVPSAPRELVRRVAAQAEAAGVPLRVVPDYDDIVRSGMRLQDVRDLRIEDLLGRAQVETDLDAVRALLQGRRVLVTGAGGSIGCEIARQVAGCEPELLVLLDHDETHLHDVASTMPGTPTLELADIRDRDRVVLAFRRHRPEVVFHAAAHKHVPILESHPDEAVLTNVVGTDNLIHAARLAGVGHFVLISTDKAVEPASVMGASKRVAELLTVQAARESGLPFCAVRFGNVLGSRGSVIPTFMRQIEAGGPVTITDPRMTRYFMSIPEAVQLVLQAAALARGREIFMLEMGEPVRIIELAKRMIHLSGRRVGTDIEIRVTGVRPGEKLEEQLRCPDERPASTSHPAILRLQPQVPDGPSLRSAVATLADLSRADDRAAVRRHLLAFAGNPRTWAPPLPEQAQPIDLTLGAGTWTPSTT